MLAFHRVLSRRTALAAIAVAALTVHAGSAFALASSGPVAAASAVTVSSSAKVYNTFNTLLRKPGGLPQAITYLNAHIHQATNYQATAMVLQLENALKAELPRMEARFTPQVSEKLMKVYVYKEDFASTLSRTRDPQLRKLLQLAASSGYRQHSSEGIIYPVVDYTDLIKYKKYVTADLQAYIDIMAAQTLRPSTNDAALAIGYQELVNRGLALEQFMAKYPKSNRYVQVANLFRETKYMIFYSPSNTPLFDYDGEEVMRANARIGYSAVLKRNPATASPLLQLLATFMSIAEASDFKKSEAVETFLQEKVSLD
ncbi:hypothetical protein [Paenibacillus swuensis]|uniref:hypothetical protein n=1 Tax=Paenibacillus swuensis TaxID=1178515 RepID=UPI0009EE8E2D|nr:hypothetical protein [Paenibacillus swuensis]